MEDLLGFNRGSDLAGLDYYDFGDLDRLGLTGASGASAAKSTPRTRGPLKTCDACSSMNAESLTARVEFAQHSNSCDLCDTGELVRLRCLFDDQNGGGVAKKDAPVPLGWIKDAEEGPKSHYPFPYVFTWPGDPATRYGIPAVNSVPENIQPDAAAEFIRACMETDTVVQGQADGPLDPPTSQPGRLIDVFPDGVETHWSEKSPVSSGSWSGNAAPDYVALSHCWGGTLTKDLITTSGNLQSRLRSISHSSLPPSFQDAVTITRSLGIRYLWIDALCIIQDSAADWATESAKMASVYGDSYLTIAADSSSDSFGGILRKRMVPDPLLPTNDNFEEIDSVLSTGEPSTLLIYRPPLTLETPEALNDSKLSTRGWTFQENILAPRTIHFAATQMVWESRGDFTTEDGLPFVRAFREFKEVRSIVASSESYSQDDLFQVWHTWLVEQNYSRRRFTKYEDRGVAVAGVARRIAAQTGARYLAGLWAHRLAADLGWFRTSELDTKAQSKSPRHPTWSWTSYDFPVAWKPAEGVFPTIRPQMASSDVGDSDGILLNDADSLLLHDVELECLDGSNDPFGPITSCRLHIRCHKGKCNLVQMPWGLSVVPLGGDPASVDDGGKAVAILDHEDSSRGPIEYLILSSTQSVVRAGVEVTLLLVKPASASNLQQPPAYTRVGVAHVQSYYNQIAESWSSQTEEVDIVLG
ncbi:hypothetical protein PG985_012121 [Apiospora marii]|uniref:uncharacterized protein n=1 Tax=Apiospora marii TaxID=335849 RepID=UPI003132437F